MGAAVEARPVLVRSHASDCTGLLAIIFRCERQQQVCPSSFTVVVERPVFIRMRSLAEESAAEREVVENRVALTNSTAMMRFIFNLLIRTIRTVDMGCEDPGRLNQELMEVEELVRCREKRRSGSQKIGF